MAAPFLPTLMKMRILVGYLGESANYNWWPTSLYSPTSRSFLEPVFVKTHRAARYHGVVEAARRVHDEHLNVGTYHLFRLPEETEQQLHSLALSGEKDVFESSMLQSQSNALEALHQLAGAKELSAVGPTALGGLHELGSPQTIAGFARVYIGAFKANTKAYPYLSA
jgi:hypothetical protein